MELTPLENGIELLKGHVESLGLAYLKNDHKMMEMPLMGSLMSHSAGNGPMDIYKTFLGENADKYEKEKVSELCDLFLDFLDVTELVLLENERNENSKLHTELKENFSTLKNEVLHNFPNSFRRSGHPLVKVLEATREKMQRREHVKNFIFKKKVSFSLISLKSILHR